jgi:hypothetical protein
MVASRPSRTAVAQQEALALAEVLMTDIELSQTATAKHVLKGMRLARLMRDEVAQQWLGFEIDGIPGTPEGLKWMTRARRWTDVAEQKATGLRLQSWMPTELVARPPSPPTREM